MQEITHEEYIKASSIVEQYKAQQKKTVQVTVGYTSVVTATVQVPDDWSIAKIKKELKTGYYEFEQDAAPDTELGKIVMLIVDGEEIIMPAK